MSEAEREVGQPDDEHQVTPLELFFDLTFVFAMTQVTSMLAGDPTWSGLLRGMLVLGALWWSWTLYAWLTSTLDVDEGGCPAGDARGDGRAFLSERRRESSGGERSAPSPCSR